MVSVNPKRYPILVLSSGDMSLPDTNGKSLRVIRRKKNEDHSFGILSHITKFKFHVAGDDNHGSFAQGKSNIIKKTLQKHLNKLQEEVGDAGAGLGLFYKGHNENTHENYVDDVDDSEKNHVMSQSLSNHL